jgi:hypothetical protein
LTAGGIWAYSDAVEALAKVVVPVARVFVSLMLLTAGVGKLIRPAVAARIWGQAFGVTESIMLALIVVLSIGETIVALGLIVTRRRLFSLVAVALSAPFLGLALLRIAGILDIADCGCFGPFALSPSGTGDVMRNALLLCCSLLLASEDHS